MQNGHSFVFTSNGLIQPSLPLPQMPHLSLSLLNLTSPASPSTGPKGPKDGGEMEENQAQGENVGSHLNVLNLRSL